MGVVSASENTTDSIAVPDTVQSVLENGNVLEITDDNQISESAVEINESDDNSKISTKITSNTPSAYYTEKCELITYLKDNDDNPLKNKKLTVFLGEKSCTRLSDDEGKVVLDLRPVPGIYGVNIKFDGDENCSASQFNTSLTINKIPLAIQTSNLDTYWGSDIFYKVNVYNRFTGEPLKNVRVLFKVYQGDSLYKQYYINTDENGTAQLDKNYDVDSYSVYSDLSNNNVKAYDFTNSSCKGTLKVLPTAEFGCCSFFAQINDNSFVCGFRRDSTYSVDIYIKEVSWYGRTAMKQYKNIGGYSFHIIVTSDGWAIGTGGADSGRINSAIENIAGNMVKSNSMPVSSVKSIMSYIRSLGIGHFAIKAPNGDYVVAWMNSYRYGKLNPGQYISVPNYQSYFRAGKISSFGTTDPGELGTKIGASDQYGVNRREVVVHYWRAVTERGSTVAHFASYASNDNGKLKGLSTSHLVDNVYFKHRYFSKNSLPQSTNSKYLGYHYFDKINYLKTQLSINADPIVAVRGSSQNLIVTVTYKSNNKLASGIPITVELYTTSTSYKTYTFTTNAYGKFVIKAHFLNFGYHRIFLYSQNRLYHTWHATGITLT